MSRVNKQSHIPFYIQLASTLRRKIEESAAAGKTFALPSENELAAEHDLSRATVRQALALLQREGLVYKEKGRGTFAAPNPVRYELTALIPTTEDMRRRGWRSSVKVVSLTEVETRPPITSALGLSAADTLAEITRLRLGDDEPVSLQWSYIPTKLAPGLITRDLSGSLTTIMEQTYGQVFWTATESLRARRASAYEAKLLKIPGGSPVIYMERTTYSPTGLPLEFLESVWRSDRYEFVFSLRRTP